MKKLLLLLMVILISGCVTRNLTETPDSIDQSESTSSQSSMHTQTATIPPRPSSTPTPAPTPTLVPDQDHDLDGLTNFEEQTKYLTNPYEADSDSDGVPDSDWEERREFVYSVMVQMKIKEPFDLAAMNDMFQDVKVVEEKDAFGYTTIEILIFPETKLSITPSAYPLSNLEESLEVYTQPGISTNYDGEMQAEVLQIVSEAKTDVEAVQTLINWFHTNTQQADFPFQPEVFYYAYIYNDEVFLRDPPNFSPRRMLDELLFANSMFEKRVHGTCCSTATFKCGMFKAAGIPCKIIQTLFPIFSHEEQLVPYENKLNRTWGPAMFENQGYGTMAWSANHCFMEVYLGGHWVRVDNDINIYHGGDSLSVKILSVPDLTDANFSWTYPVDWIHNRPYYTLLIEDQEPVNKSD